MAQNNFKVKTGIEMPSLDTFVTTDQTQIPSVLPSLNLDFTTKQLDPRITFSRADTTTCATYIDQLGVMKTAPANVPRFDHDPVTGKCLGLLIEESRTNSCKYSSLFSSWTNGGSTITANAATAPDGTNTAFTITDSNTSGYQYIAVSSLTSYTASQIWCASIYVLKDSTPSSTRYPLLRLDFLSSTKSIDVSLDTMTGAVFGKVNGDGVINSYGCIDCGNYWRIWVSGSSATGTSMTVSFYPAVGTAFGAAHSSANTGSATIWGAQLELGEFPTSYINVPSTTAITRAADLAAITGTNFTSFYNQFESTVGVEFGLPISTPGQTNRILDFNSSSTNRNSLYCNTSKQLAFFINNNGIESNIYTNGVTNPSDFRNTKLYLAFKDNDVALSSEGKLSGTMLSSTATIAKDVTQMQIGNYPTANTIILCGTIKHIVYYPKRLSNAEIQALSIL